MDVLLARQFNDGDAAGRDGVVRGTAVGAALHSVAALPGVIEVEPMRTRGRAAALRVTRTRTLALTGLEAGPHLNRVVDQAGQPHALPPEGLVLSKMLAGILDVGPGDRVRVEVLEGRRPACARARGRRSSTT